MHVIYSVFHFSLHWLFPLGLLKEKQKTDLYVGEIRKKIKENLLLILKKNVRCQWIFYIFGNRLDKKYVHIKYEYK